MRTNGTLQYSKSVGGGFDEGGAPIPMEDSWSDPVPCSIRSVMNNSKGRYEDGKFNQTSYDVLVETGSIPLTVTRIRLVRDDGTQLGEFSVQGTPQPMTMCRIKLSV